MLRGEGRASGAQREAPGVFLGDGSVQVQCRQRNGRAWGWGMGLGFLMEEYSVGRSGSQPATEMEAGQRPRPQAGRPPLPWQIIGALEEDPVGQKMQLACRLQQIAALVENKVTEL